MGFFNLFSIRLNLFRLLNPFIKKSWHVALPNHDAAPHITPVAAVNCRESATRRPYDELDRGHEEVAQIGKLVTLTTA
jgi:hypothetical protein